MERKDYFGLTIFALISLALILWVRFNLEFFKPVLESSTLFFQLILASTIIAVLRNVVGIKTFGVFGPTIIAFGLVQAGLLWGLVLYLDIFIITVIMGILLYPFGLPTSHRVAVLITFTGITITIMELLGEIYHLPRLEAALLFPVLITSWLADRYTIQVKEIDWVQPSKSLLGTVFVTIIAYIIISYQQLILFITMNPEMWIGLIMLNIFIGTKINLRLSEIRRFKPILENDGKKEDILGLNKRNREYIFKHNPRPIFPYVSKDRMKRMFHHIGIATPQTYCMVKEKKGLMTAMKVMEREESFVIKPSAGLGGEGIWVVDAEEQDGKRVYIAKGRSHSLGELKEHIVQIIDGQYSSEWDDVAIIEEKIIVDPEIAKYIVDGVPDIRVIVFEGFPIMAMTRIPTRESGGAANLHKGAIGMGLSISDGSGINPFWRGRGGTIHRHPDTNAVLKDMKIPRWSEILELACLVQGASRLGYVGVDIVLSTKGPVVLEVNKRPGLEIQNTNLSGLLKRIEFLEDYSAEYEFEPVSERVKLAREWDKGDWT